MSGIQSFLRGSTNSAPGRCVYCACGSGNADEQSSRSFPTSSLIPLLRRTRRGAKVLRQQNDGGQLREDDEHDGSLAATPRRVHQADR
jgi:hypothetical protein